MRPSHDIVALLPAAGTGSRLGDARPKQYLELAGKPLIHHALAAIAAVPRVMRTVVVVSPQDTGWDAWVAHLHPGVDVLRVGGATRAASVLNGLLAIAPGLAPDARVLVHDAARPLVAASRIEQLIDEALDEEDGGLLAVPLADTIKRAGTDARVAQTLSREHIWRAQTPQLFPLKLLVEALRRFPGATDESQAVEALGRAPRLVPGDSRNFKVTIAEDLAMAEALLAARETG
ncbi:MAG TPA: 2-C-methyl-D-erythritol 4-phosphate cytidylyltransferase [Usitatibacteraceae bacterium]|nr:2-C-methyl-D-erythritol 4-phosphate cytidylyltransferase [Usitatibacteraceae bacterium]